MSIDLTRFDITRGKENVILGLEEGISIEDFFQELPDEQCYPDLNALLRERIRNIESENGHLRQESDETRQYLEDFRDICQREISKLDKTREIWEERVAELSARCDDLTSKLENVRSECAIHATKMAADSLRMAADGAKMAAAEAKIAEMIASNKKMEKNVVLTDAEMQTVEETRVISDDTFKDDQMRILKEKLGQTNARLYEMKNNCTHLRQELNKAQKLLWSEIGEGATIASLSSRGNGGWRGRAEQIQQLKLKITDLQGKLNEYEKSSKSLSSFTGSTTTEERNLSYLRNLEKERRRAMENCARELRQAEMGVETRERKLQAARARIKILENELASARTSLTLLNEKRIHDDRLIEALNGQLGAIEGKFRERERLAHNERTKAEEACKELRNELSTVNTRIELLRKRLEERETEIDDLRKARGGTSRRPEVGSSVASSCVGRNVWKEETRTMTVAETEQKNPNEYVTMGLAAEAERRRLLELVKILNERLDKERTNTDRIDELLRQERCKSAKLESKLQRLEMERVGIAARTEVGYGTSRSNRCNANGNATADKTNNAEKIRFKIELLEEECLALKARLTSVEREKSADLTIYTRMLEETRKTFREALR